MGNQVDTTESKKIEAIRAKQYVTIHEEQMGSSRYLKVLDSMPDLYTRFLEQLDEMDFYDELLDDSGTPKEESITKALSAIKFEFDNEEFEYAKQRLLSEIAGLGPLDELMADERISDILVNGYQEIFVEVGGELKATSISFYHDNHLQNIVHRILAKTNGRVDRVLPYANTRLEDGSRVNIVIPPASPEGTTVSIRRFNRKFFSLESMIENNALNHEVAQFLKIAVQAKLNILITGGAGAGKTTLLNAMAHEVPSDERLVLIEDVAELDITHPHLVRLEAQTESIEGLGQVSIKNLFINTLRMRPSRIIIGEVRGDEILEMLQAMNSGHDGSLSTLHASSAEDVPYRILNIIAMSGVDIPSSAILAQIINNIDVIVEVSHLSSGERFVKRVCECQKNPDFKYRLHEIFSIDLEKDGDGPGSIKVQSQDMSTALQEKIQAQLGTISVESQGGDDEL